jgi:hypothetical protein
MRIEEIVVGDDTPATPIADGQGSNEPVLGTVDTPPVDPNAAAPAAAGDPIDKEMEVPIPDSELNADLEEVEGEYGPPAGLTEDAGEAIEDAREEENVAHEEIMALENFFLTTKQIIDKKVYTQESLDLARLGLEQYLKPSKLGGLAMEGRDGATIELQHQLVLEGIKESIKSALHSAHTANSASVDNIKMIFTSVETDVKRYEAGLEKAIAKFEDFLKTNGKEKLHLDMHILQNFFNVNRQQAARLPEFIRKDLQFDEFVLTKFSVACEKELEHFADLLASEKTFAGLAQGVEKMKHPFDLFDKKWISDSYTTPLLGGYFAQRRYPMMIRSRDAFGAFGKLSKLEQLGSSARITIGQQYGNAVRAVATSSPLAVGDYLVAGATSPVLAIDPKEILQIADLAKQYLKNIQFFMQVLKSTSKTHDKVMERLLNFETEDINQKQANQLFHYLSALESGAVSTGRQEVTRALKAVFYSIALINRSTFVNK